MEWGKGASMANTGECRSDRQRTAYISLVGCRGASVQSEERSWGRRLYLLRKRTGVWPTMSQTDEGLAGWQLINKEQARQGLGQPGAAVTSNEQNARLISGQTSSNLGRGQDCMEPTPVGLFACLSDVPPRGSGDNWLGLGSPCVGWAIQDSSLSRLTKGPGRKGGYAPRRRIIFSGEASGSTAHWPGSWMEESIESPRQTAPFLRRKWTLPCPQPNRRSPQPGVSTPSSIQDHLNFSFASTSLFLQLLGWVSSSSKPATRSAQHGRWMNWPSQAH